MDNIFHLFGKPTTPSDLTQRKQPYIAAEAERERQNAFTVHYGGDCTEVVYYGYILRIVLLNPLEMRIVSTQGLYLIDGRNLTPLIPLLREQQLSSIHIFDRNIHIEPPEDQPVITEIEYLLNEQYIEWAKARREAAEQESGPNDEA